MEIPASHGGVVTERKVKLGDKVKEGSVVCCWRLPAQLLMQYRLQRPRHLHQLPLRLCRPQLPAASVEVETWSA
jgi:hypothetical protein